MTIHLYQQSAAEAFRLSLRTLLKLGFTVHLADELKGMISGQKQVKSTDHLICFDVKISVNRQSTGLSLISSLFSGSTGNFTADSLSETLFLETFHDLLRIQPPDNPLKLSYNDYAMAVGF